MCAENVRTRAVVTFTPFWPNWRQAGGSLEAGWRHAGGRLEAGWRQAGGRLEHTWVTTRFWLLFRRLFKVGPAWAGGQAYPSMVGSMVGSLPPAKCSVNKSVGGGSLPPGFGCGFGESIELSSI